jgi:hypothetical protein
VQGRLDLTPHEGGFGQLGLPPRALAVHLHKGIQFGIHFFDLGEMGL